MARYSSCKGITVGILLASWLALAEARYARVEQALTCLHAVVDVARSRKVLFYEAFRVSALVEACLLSGRMIQAAEHAERELQIAQGTGERSQEAGLRYLFGEIAGRADLVDDAIVGGFP